MRSVLLRPPNAAGLCTFQCHEDVTVIVVVMHVILDLRVGVDHHKGGKTECSTLEVATFRVGVLPEQNFLLQP